MITRKAAPFAPAVLALLLSACATGSDDRYPSLAVRDAERISGSAEPVETERAPPPPVEPTADLTQRLRQLRNQAEQAHRGFLAALSQTRSAVSAGAGSDAGSESWAVAMAALANLDATRNPATLALTELDALYVQAEIEEGPVTAISADRETVLSLVSEEERTLDELGARLGV